MTRSLSFCQLKFSNNYVTCVVDENVAIEINESRQQTVEILDHFKTESFVYITHRVNSYSVDPGIYLESSKIDGLKGIAVVSNRDIALSNAEIERLFFKKPFKIFSNLEEAKVWANKLILKHKQLK